MAPRVARVIVNVLAVIGACALVVILAACGLVWVLTKNADALNRHSR